MPASFFGDITVSQYKFGTADPTIYMGDVLIYPLAPQYDYLSFEALDDDFTFGFSRSGLEYSLNSGRTWTALSANTFSPPMASGDTVLLRGEMVPVVSPSNPPNGGIGSFRFTNGRCKVKGDPTSLLSGNTMSAWALCRLFNDMSNGTSGLTDASELVLTSTTVYDYCYFNMFYKCTGLTAAPALPATTLATQCYSGMFEGCTALTTAPVLPAQTLVNSCYDHMFFSCSSLNYIKCMATDISANNCTRSWVSGVAPTGTFVKDPGMDNWTIGVNGIPTGWVVQNVETGFTIKALDNNFTFQNTKAVTYSTDNGATWTSLAANTSSPQFASGTTIMVNGNTFDYVGTISSVGRFKAYGNPKSLRYGSSWSGHTPLVGENQYPSLFSGATGLTDAAGLLLTATTVSNYGYQNMFYDCTSLTATPSLPATTVGINGYQCMFYGCTSLVTAPSISATTLGQNACNGMFYRCSGMTTAPATLPATTLNYGCYQYMFYGCTSLTTAPTLPATTLTGACYASMFMNCTSLTTAPVLPAEVLAGGCYEDMFYNCHSLNYIKCLAKNIGATDCTHEWVVGVASTGTFVKDNSMSSWTRGRNGIPTNWTVQNEGVVCYDVTSNIGTYTGTTYVDVYDSTQEKWFKLNNLGQYEEYGVYGEGTNITTYVGKLTVANGHEWEWNGSSWVDQGEVSATTASLPNVSFTINYNAKDYDETTSSLTKTAGQLYDSDIVLDGNSAPTVSSDHITIEDDYDSIHGRISDATDFNRDGEMPDFTLICKAKSTKSSDGILLNNGGSWDCNWRFTQNTDSVNFGNSPYGGSSLSLQNDGNPKICSVRVGDNGNITLDEWTTSATTSYTDFFYGGSANEGSLFSDDPWGGYEYWAGDFYWIYVAKSILTDAQIQQVINYNDVGSTIEYPVEYSAMTAPVTSVTFQSVAEMEVYECPYEGLIGIVGNDVYVYSTSNGWEQVQPTTLPYFALEAEQDNFKFQFAQALEYSTNSGISWNTLSANTNSKSLSSGTTVIIRANVQGSSNTFSTNGNFKAKGNVMSLLFGDNFTGQTDMSGKSLSQLFSGCTGLTSAENLSLPATTLAKSCYFEMFQGCTSLTTAPSTLPATTLTTSCYASMFYKCSGLTTAPDLPATTLVQSCYSGMFRDCTNLNRIKCLATDISANYCTANFLSNVAPSGTFIKNPSMSSWPRGWTGIPSAWTVVDAT